MEKIRFRFDKHHTFLTMFGFNKVQEKFNNKEIYVLDIYTITINPNIKLSVEITKRNGSGLTTEHGEKIVLYTGYYFFHNPKTSLLIFKLVGIRDYIYNTVIKQ